MRSILTSIIIVISMSVFAQTAAPFEPFDLTKYTNAKHHINSDTAIFSKFKIISHQVSVNRYQEEPNDTPCFAWLTILHDDIAIKQLYFNRLESVGNCYGIFFPKVQPMKDYYFISIIGAYEGDFFVLDTLGNLLEYDGGEFYVSADKHYLFSTSASDLPGLTVIDLTSMKVLFSDTIETYTGNWYFKDGNYFAEIWEMDKSIPNRVAKFNFDTSKIEIKSEESDLSGKAIKLKNYNVIERTKACNCGQ